MRLELNMATSINHCYPLRKDILNVIARDSTGCNAKKQVNDFIVGEFQPGVVNRQEKFRDGGGDPFVAINEGVPPNS
jgi:hypothetical protein